MSGWLISNLTTIAVAGVAVGIAARYSRHHPSFEGLHHPISVVVIAGVADAAILLAVRRFRMNGLLAFAHGACFAVVLIAAIPAANSLIGWE